MPVHLLYRAFHVNNLLTSRNRVNNSVIIVRCIMPYKFVPKYICKRPRSVPYHTNFFCKKAQSIDFHNTILNLISSTSKGIRAYDVTGVTNFQSHRFFFYIHCYDITGIELASLRLSLSSVCEPQFKKFIGLVV